MIIDRVYKVNGSPNWKKITYMLRQEARMTNGFRDALNIGRLCHSSYILKDFKNVSLRFNPQ